MGGLRDDIRQVARGWRWSHRPLVPRSAEPWMPSPREPTPATAWARSVPARQVREVIQSGILKPLVWAETRPRVHGLDRLEDVRGPVVFASNHASHLDAPLVLCSLPKRLRQRTVVGAASDYFFDAWWRSAGTALAFNAFPIDRAGSRHVTADARGLVADGWNLLLFPEGTRSKDGWVRRFRHGTGRLCVDLGIPAVPIAIRGSYAAMPRGRGWPRPGRQPVSIHYGAPIFPEPGEMHRSFTRRLRHGVARLWDEDATTWWEALRREADDATPEPTGPEGPSWRRVWEATRPLPDDEPAAVWRRP
jgi:1-acyl-sn-glycerol-3-phosphate acyltransferase